MATKTEKQIEESMKAFLEQMKAKSAKAMVYERLPLNETGSLFIENAKLTSTTPEGIRRRSKNLDTIVIGQPTKPVTVLAKLEEVPGGTVFTYKKEAIAPHLNRIAKTLKPAIDNNN